MIYKNRSLMASDGTVPMELLEKCIKQHMKEIPRLEKLDNYMDGRHKILGRYFEDNSIPNNRLVANHAEYISTILVGYVHGAPVVYSGDGSSALRLLFKETEEESHNAELGMNISEFGRGYELLYMNSDEVPIPELAVLSPFSTNVVCDTTIKHKCMFAFSYVEEADINDFCTGYIITVYCKGFTDTIICSNLRSAATYRLVSREPSYFGKVPVTEYRNNKKGRGDYEGVITLIDAYNLLQSDRLNDKEQLADALLAIESGTLGDDETERSETAALIKKEKILELEPGGKAYWVVKNMNEDQVEVLKRSIKDDIHEFAQVPCLTDDNFVGNSSGVALKYKLIGLEDKGKTKERYFKRGLKRRLRMYENIFYLQAIPFKAADISITMKRTLPVDEETLAKVAQETEGLLSWETRINRFDPDLDAEAERTRLQAEQQNTVKQKQVAFGSYDFKDLE